MNSNLKISVLENQMEFLNNVLFTYNGEIYEIYSVRKDGKIYFWNHENHEEQYNGTIEEFHKKLEDGSWTLV